MLNRSTANVAPITSSSAIRPGRRGFAPMGRSEHPQRRQKAAKVGTCFQQRGHLVWLIRTSDEHHMPRPVVGQLETESLSREGKRTGRIGDGTAQRVFEFLGRQRRGKEEALHELTALLHEEIALAGGFDALGQYVHSQTAGH